MTDDGSIYEAVDILQEIAYTRACEHIWYEMNLDGSIAGLAEYYGEECKGLIDSKRWRTLLESIDAKHDEWMNRPRENPIFTQSDMDMMLTYSMGQNYACDASYYESKMHCYARMFGSNLKEDLGDITQGMDDGIHGYIDTFYGKYDEWMQGLDGERYEFARFIRTIMPHHVDPEPKVE